jgi:putative restriction endonuclease
MHLGSTFGHSFIDACHIVPFSVSHDDRVTNGLALCPNIHRAFDRGLVTVDDSFRVLLSSHIREDKDHTYSLKRFDHQEIKLPQNKYAWPDLAMLRWHREHLFRN